MAGLYMDPQGKTLMIAPQSEHLERARSARGPLGWLLPLLLLSFALAASPQLQAQNSGNAGDANEFQLSIAGPTTIKIKSFLYIVSQQLGIRFLLNSTLNGGDALNTVDIIAPAGRVDDPSKAAFNIPRSALFSMLQALLKQNKFILVPFGEDTPNSVQFYEVMALADAMTSSRAEDVVILDSISSFRGDGAGFVTLIAPIKHQDANSVRTALAPLGTRGGQVVPIGRDLLLIADYESNVRRLAKIIELLDQPPRAPRTEIINIEHLDAEEMANALRDLMDARRNLINTAGTGRTGTVPLLEEEVVEITLPPNVNAIWVHGQDKGITLIKSMVDKLDQPIPGMEGVQNKFHTYKARNVLAGELATTLQNLVGQGIPLGDGVTPITPPGVTPNPPVPQGSGNFSDYQPVIEFDENTNTLIVIAKPTDYNALRKIIEVLDVRRPQVMIEAAILEVRQDEDFTFGVEVATIDNSGNGVRVNAGTQFGFSEIVDADGVPVGTGGGEPAGRTPLFGNGGLIALTKGGPFNIPLLISFLKTQTNVNILSVPRVMANDNEPARIEILTEVPVSRSDVTGNSGVTSSDFRFEEDGIILNVTPQISEGGYVVLDLEFEVKAFIGAAAQPGAPPPRTTRNIQTFVTVPDGQTVVIGGLTSNTSSKSVSKVPFIGDVPFLGELFKSESTTSRQTNLYIFVRPIIFKDKDFELFGKHSQDTLREARGNLLPTPSVTEYFESRLQDNTDRRLSSDPTTARRRLALPDLQTK